MRRIVLTRRLTAFVAVAITFLATVVAVATVTVRPAAAAPTGGNDDLRTGWYPDQPGLSPAQVARPDFGQLFDTTVTGQVYAQPLVSNGVLLVTTEENWIYGLNPVTGAVLWSRQLRQPFHISTEIPSCSDLVPNIGITGTPVVDPTGNGTMYLLSKGYASGSSGDVGYWFHGIDVQTGAESFTPVRVQGTADNDGAVSFAARTQLQRPALTLMNGVVYAAFGAHCDVWPYQGWIVGLSTASHAIRGKWQNANASLSGNGIWQSGGGIMSDRAGRLYIASGNGPGPAAATAGSTPPEACSECIERVDVQADGTLAARDFFRPYDADFLDAKDLDFGSGAPVELPLSMGTAAHPRIVLAVGKQGYVYMLDADHLGGYKMKGGGDDVIGQPVGPHGGVWSKPSVWPGDGGWIYVPTSGPSGNAAGSSGYLHAYKVGADGTGTPTLSLQTSDAQSAPFGFGSSAPVVTSDGTTSGSALVWVVWMSDGSGQNAELRAYDAVPSGGKLNLRFAAPVGTGSKFNSPGVAGGRVYVGTRDGHVRGFGIPAAVPVNGAAVSFAPTVIGQTASATAIIRANANVTVQSVAVTSGPFTNGAPTLAVPGALAANQTMSVPVTFRPSALGLVGGVLHVTTSAGSVDVALSGTGESATGILVGSPPAVSFGGVAQGNTSSTVVTFTNGGATPITVTKVTVPPAPFAASGVPAVGAVIAPLASVTVTVSFAPTALGDFTGALVVESSGGVATVDLSGAAAAPGALTVSSTTIDAGVAVAGSEGQATFFVTNSGGLPLTITKSKPPASGAFVATSTLNEGTVLAPGESRRLDVAFRPSGTGTFTGAWILNGDGDSALTNVTFTGLGVTGVPAGLGLLQALPPARLLDTRASAIVPGGTSVVVPFAGHGGVPATVTGALVNVTVTGSSGPGYLTAYPCGQPVPLASNVNFAAGQTAANLAAVQIGAGGSVCVFASTAAHVIVDADGYFSATAGSYVDAVSPARLLDTRPGAIVGPGLVTVAVAGRAGVPVAATSAVLNVTVTQTSGAGYASVFPCGQPVPGSSNVNWSGPGQTAANLASVGIGTTGNVCIFLSAPSHVVVDVDGYLVSTPGSAAAALSPARLHDSRPGNALAGGAVRSIPVAGLGGNGADASAAFVNVTVTEPTAPGYLTAFPCGQSPPGSSNVNYGPGRTVANLALVGLGSGAVCLYTSATTQIVVDGNGWMRGA